MKRYLLIAAICLLAGAVVNVAVAWGIACVPLYKLDPQPGSSPKNRPVWSPTAGWRFWSIEHRDFRGGVLYESVLVPGSSKDPSTDLRPDELAPSWASLRTPPDTDFEMRWVLAFGWPLVSMWCDYGPGDAIPPQVDQYGDRERRLLHGLPVTFLPPDNLLPKAVPLNPIWPAFAVNTILYAVALWLLIGGPLVLRRFIRLRSGLCPKCAYPMGEAAVCTECGKALRARMPRPWSCSSSVKPWRGVLSFDVKPNDPGLREN